MQIPFRRFKTNRTKEKKSIKQNKQTMKRKKKCILVLWMKTKTKPAATENSHLKTIHVNILTLCPADIHIKWWCWINLWGNRKKLFLFRFCFTCTFRRNKPFNNEIDFDRRIHADHLKQRETLIVWNDEKHWTNGLQMTHTYRVTPKTVWVLMRAAPSEKEELF